jgi:hypothetical protein
MTIEEACRIILGNKIAAAIINDQGVHWAVVAAMSVAQTNHDSRALKAIRDWNTAQKAENAE